MRGENKVGGFIRIRGKTRGIALSLGDKITLLQVGGERVRLPVVCVVPCACRAMYRVPCCRACMFEPLEVGRLVAAGFMHVYYPFTATVDRVTHAIPHMCTRHTERRRVGGGFESRGGGVWCRRRVGRMAMRPFWILKQRQQVMRTLLWGAGVTMLFAGNA